MYFKGKDSCTFLFFYFFAHWIIGNKHQTVLTDIKDLQTDHLFSKYVLSVAAVFSRS